MRDNRPINLSQAGLIISYTLPLYPDVIAVRIPVVDSDTLIVAVLVAQRQGQPVAVARFLGHKDRELFWSNGERD